MNPSFFQLPVNFSIEKLKQEFQFCETENWPAHFNTQHYSGGWSSISLRSGTGSTNDIHSFPNQKYLNTSLLNACPYFQEAIDWFKCEIEAVRLLRLDPQSEIKEHTDNDTSYEDGFFRIHIPIFTNPGVEFYVNNQLVLMKEGECWYANFQLPHRVQNTGAHPRVHLVIDCIRNGWSDELFTNAGFDLTRLTQNNTLSDDVKQQIINELLRNPTETNMNLVASLQMKK
jgi:hypothetical protein